MPRRPLVQGVLVGEPTRRDVRRMALEARILAAGAHDRIRDLRDHGHGRRHGGIAFYTDEETGNQWVACACGESRTCLPRLLS